MTEPTLTVARTPRLGLPFLFPGQAQKEAFVNEGFARLDAQVQSSIVATLVTPPSAPLPGQTFAIAAQATGDWAGRDGEVASWTGSQWLYFEAVEGALFFDLGRQAFIRRSDAGTWIDAAAPTVPESGAVQDTELRSMCAQIVAQLRQLGIFA